MFQSRQIREALEVHANATDVGWRTILLLLVVTRTPIAKLVARKDILHESVALQKKHMINHGRDHRNVIRLSQAALTKLM